MAFDYSNFINQILSEQEISKRILSLSSVLNLTHQRMQNRGSNPISQNVSPSVSDLKMINRFNWIGQNREAITDAEFLGRIMEISIEMATKMLANHPESFYGEKRTLIGGDPAVETSAVPKIKEGNTVYLITLIDQIRMTLGGTSTVYDAFDEMSNLFSKTGLWNDSASAYFVVFNLVEYVVTSDHYNSGDIQFSIPTQAPEDIVTAVETSVNDFLADSGITLKNLQETVYGILFEEVI